MKDEESKRASRKPLGGAEYAALRDEILKRIELQYQLLNLALIVAGTVVTVSLGGGALPNAEGRGGQKLLLLVCPLLEMFLAFGWAAHNVQIAKAGKYIKANYAEGWESYWPRNEGLSRQRRVGVTWFFTGGAPARGVFAGTQVLTLLLAYFAFPATEDAGFWLGWYVADGVMILITLWCIHASNIRDQLDDDAAVMSGLVEGGGAGAAAGEGGAADGPAGEAR